MGFICMCDVGWVKGSAQWLLARVVENTPSMLGSQLVNVKEVRLLKKVKNVNSYTP